MSSSRSHVSPAQLFLHFLQQFYTYLLPIAKYEETIPADFNSHDHTHGRKQALRLDIKQYVEFFFWKTKGTSAKHHFSSWDSNLSEGKPHVLHQCDLRMVTNDRLTHGTIEDQGHICQVKSCKNPLKPSSR